MIRSWTCSISSADRWRITAILPEGSLIFIGYRKCHPSFISDKFRFHKKLHDQDRIEHEIVQGVLDLILPDEGYTKDAVIYESDHMQMYLLWDGTLFISDQLLHSIKDFRILVFLILKKYEILSRQFLIENLASKVKYGDFRRQLFFFKAKYTGYDALFIDYLTNMRYTLDQVRQAELDTVQSMHDMLAVDFSSKAHEK